MEYTRIQRLLLAEYHDLTDETILIESPFAETTRDGQGIRELAIGLTRTRLIIAMDIFGRDQQFWCPPNFDPSIESLELISVYPLELVKLSVFRRRRRRTLKARLVDGRTRYYELGGMVHRSTIWVLWRRQVRRLFERRCLGSSLSETTAAASSTCTSTTYVVSPRRRRVTDGGYNPIWTQKKLYLGTSYEELWNGRYKPLPMNIAESSYGEVKEKLVDQRSKSLQRDVMVRKIHQVVDDPIKVVQSRRNDRRSCDLRLLVTDTKKNSSNLLNFQSNNQCSSIVLDFENHEFDSWSTCRCTNTSNTSSVNIQRSKKLLSLSSKFINKFPRFGFGVEEKCVTSLCLETFQNTDIEYLKETGVAIWENKRNGRCNLRKYGVSTASHFFDGLGPWPIQPGDRKSMQNRRSRSCMNIRCHPRELRLPVSHRQLAISVSLTELNRNLPTTGCVVLFWTPDYWYRPRPASDAYKELRKHLRQLGEYREENERKSSRRGIFIKRRHSSSSKESYKNTDNSIGCIINRILTRNQTYERIQNSPESKKTTTSATATTYLRKLLKLEYRLTLWDFDSTTLAEQLTLIDRELFLRISRYELEIVAKYHTSRDAINLTAWIAFAHRISCLTTSQVLVVRQIDIRARLIARLLNVADKCFTLGNFHSSRSIVAGLQSPAIYRLKMTWMHLKTHHDTQYEIMEKLSKLFKNTKTMKYQKIWKRVEENSVAMPFVGDVLAKLIETRSHCEKLKRTKQFKFKRQASNRQVANMDRCIDQSTESKSIIKNYGNDKTIQEIITWVELCQDKVRNYDFTGHTLAWEFLLKARYREETNNFYRSLLLES